VPNVLKGIHGKPEYVSGTIYKAEINTPTASNFEKDA